MARSSDPTRARILAAANKLFYAEGIRGVSVDAVAEKAGITKKTLYYHFRSKDDLVAAYLAARDQPNLELFKRWFDEADGVRRALTLPGVDHEDADHLAEKLADLRRRDEIAMLAERFAGAIIAVFGIRQAEREIIGHADRTVGPDQGLYLFCKWCAGRGVHDGLASDHAFTVAATRARMIAQMPTAIIGSDRIIPMVSQFVPSR